MINQVLLIGRLTKAPELKHTSEEVPVLNIVLAVNRFGKSKKAGQDADFVPCVAWGYRAEEIAGFCHKGSLVALSGEVQSRSYVDRDGKRVRIIEVIIHKFRYLEPRKIVDKQEAELEVSKI